MCKDIFSSKRKQVAAKMVSPKKIPAVSKPLPSTVSPSGRVWTVISQPPPPFQVRPPQTWPRAQQPQPRYMSQTSPRGKLSITLLPRPRRPVPNLLKLVGTANSRYSHVPRSPAPPRPRPKPAIKNIVTIDSQKYVVFGRTSPLLKIPGISSECTVKLVPGGASGNTGAGNDDTMDADEEGEEEIKMISEVKSQDLVP